ncbi:hypothetical protein SSPO_032710 [Streptomyces antimycoticus]|uniref:Protein kinase domain-containing protein n=1 Tax=Streptomyces antimycoticus TaxID=68175 RepID=A0A499UGI4_9ACTN|nr:hypothetical protein SSPO_032710 [Streptomyces antimycoticus]
MEPLSQDDPRRLGPYYVIARLGPDAGEVPATARHFIARGAAGDRTVVVTAPSQELADDVAYRERFLAEAENARLLGGGRPPLWLAPVVEVSGGGTGQPWSTTPFLPMLSLPAVPEANGGPLPVRTVRALGAALAETLAEVHTAGFAHAGAAPGTVYLAGDGPRLMGYGAVRAAAPDGEARVGLPGLEDDALPRSRPRAGGRGRWVTSSRWAPCWHTRPPAPEHRESARGRAADGCRRGIRGPERRRGVGSGRRRGAGRGLGVDRPGQRRWHQPGRGRAGTGVAAGAADRRVVRAVLGGAGGGDRTG